MVTIIDLLRLKKIEKLRFYKIFGLEQLYYIQSNEFNVRNDLSLFIRIIVFLSGISMDKTMADKLMYIL